MPRKAVHKDLKFMPNRAERCLRPGVRRYVHVFAPALKANLENGSRAPMVVIRPASDPSQTLVVRNARILGPSVLAERYEDPLPGTGGRAICYMDTEAEIVCDL